MADWWDAWRKTRVLEVATSRKYESHWRTHVKPRWGNVNLGAVTAWDVEAWIADMENAKVGKTTQYQSFQLLRTMLADAARHKRIGLDPTATVKIKPPPKHVDRFLTRPEFEALVEQMPTDRDQAMVMLMAMAGLRWGEVAGLHAHRVDLGRGELRVKEVLRRDNTIKKDPKSTAGERIVPLVPVLRDALAPFVEKGLVFPGLDYDNWRRRVFNPAREAAGLAEPLPTIHDLRHSYGSWLAEGGVSPTDVMALMGHSSLRATERYLHSGDGRFGRALSALAAPQIAAP